MYMPVLIVYLAEVGLSLTKGQTAPSLALAAILVAQITKGGIGLASSLRQRATASNCSGEIKSVALDDYNSNFLPTDMCIPAIGGPSKKDWFTSGGEG